MKNQVKPVVSLTDKFIAKRSGVTVKDIVNSLLEEFSEFDDDTKIVKKLTKKMILDKLTTKICQDYANFEYECVVDLDEDDFLQAMTDYNAELVIKFKFIKR